MTTPYLRTESLASLRAAVRALESPAGRGAGAIMPFGIDAVDRRLADGGLAVAALHEAAPARGGLPDEAAATLFLAALAARRAGPVLWALARRDLFAPGLAAAGLAPDRILYAECGRDEEVLAAMEEGLRHGGLAAVVGEARRAPMAATRRLQLAAEEGATPALLLRRRRKPAEDPLATPSAAVTRWRIGAAPSAPLPAAGIGRARWHVFLARQRGGEPCDWILEAPDAEARLALPAGTQHRAGETRAAA
ncbi:MAG: protein ImuA [Alphaproteobacteria bacterium]|nr:protein ImuA [Alphaproteobacteria bacterium]MBV9929538.1 protein ImuA [Alphaproteobacteria bacterium]